MSCNKPNWLLLKECGEKLTKQGIIPFSRKQLIDCVKKNHPDKKEGSLNPMIQGMTVNLTGGSPGGVGKKVFRSVNHGLFELYNPQKHTTSISFTSTLSEKENNLIHSIQQKVEEDKEIEQVGKKESSEDEMRDYLMNLLYQRFGKDTTWKGSGKSAVFELKDEFNGYKCFAEKSLSYNLPTGYKMKHASDILIINDVGEKYISIEIKHKSAVTDQFKCRSYDMLHLKNTYKDNLFGIMVYVKTTSGGNAISPEHAKEISYMFDYFLHVSFMQKNIPTVWEPLFNKVIESINNF